MNSIKFALRYLELQKVITRTKIELDLRKRAKVSYIRTTEIHDLEYEDLGDMQTSRGQRPVKPYIHSKNNPTTYLVQTTMKETDHKSETKPKNKFLQILSSII